MEGETSVLFKWVFGSCQKQAYLECERSIYPLRLRILTMTSGGLMEHCHPISSGCFRSQNNLIVGNTAGKRLSFSAADYHATTECLDRWTVSSTGFHPN